MDRYRNIKPAIVFATATVLSLIMGLFSGYLADVARLSLLVFGVIGLATETLNTSSSHQRRNSWWLIGVGAAYMMALSVSRWVSIPLIFVAGFLWWMVVSSEETEL